MLFLLFSVVFGYLAGYFLTLPILILISLVCLLITIVMSMKYQEMEGLITLIFGACATLGNLVMWATYYVTTDQTFLGEFIQKYIIR